MGEYSELDIARARLLKLDYECAMDPERFFDTMLYTFDPKREPYHLPFNLFPFQRPLVAELVNAIENGYDIFLDKTREMGATYTVLGVLLWYWKYKPAANFLIGSRKEDIVDNVGKVAQGEVSNKEESLFGKLDYMIERLPQLVKPTGFSQSNRTYMSLLNPELGNVISGESSNPNFSRGGRQKAIMLDEFAFWDNDDAAWGSTADTTNCRIVLTTPGIRPNTKAKRLRFGRDGEVIKVISLPYHLDPRKTEMWLNEQRERRSREDFAREIMIDWEGSIGGIVYPEARQREVGNYPYNPSWPLYVSWDFGLDGTPIQWWQYNKDNGKVRLIDAFKETDKPIQWFFPFFGHAIDSTFAYERKHLEAIDRVKHFKKAKHFGDPDVAKRSMTSRALTSVRNELESINIYVQTNTMSNTFANRREKTKILLQRGFEVNETDGTTGLEGWIESMDYARYPQRPDNSQATTGVTLPIHDYTSHHRTATEYFAVNFERPGTERIAGLVTSTPQEVRNESFLVNSYGQPEGLTIDIKGALNESREE